MSRDDARRRSPRSAVTRAAFGAAVAALGCLLAASGLPARAEPAFAVRTGYRCSQCHMNRTGGGVRTAFGSVYTQTVLPRRLLNWREGNNLLPADPDARFAVGGDVRLQEIGVRTQVGDNAYSFEVPEANLYVEARLLPGKLSLYLDEKVGPGGSSARELFALASFRRGRSYLKFGKFLPVFGWRLPDDDAFVRQFSGFTYSAQDVGLEFGAEPGRWSFHVAAINGGSGGSDNDTSKKFTLQTVRRVGNGRLGLSGSNNISGGVTTTHAGLLGGVNLGRLAFLAEGDWVQSSRSSGTTRQWLALIEADLLVSRGVNIKFAHDWIDPDRDVSTDGQQRDSLGVEYIPYPFVQLRLFVRTKDGPPQLPGSDDQFEFELHLFF